MDSKGDSDSRAGQTSWRMHVGLYEMVCVVGSVVVLGSEYRIPDLWLGWADV